MNREEILKVVKNYIENDHDKFAILINGAWGSGKTYLYENYLRTELEKDNPKRKRHIYISLYGVSSVDDISKQLVAEYMLYSRLGNRMADCAYKVSGVFGIICRGLTFTHGDFSANLDDVISHVMDVIEPKNSVICFDDLERCSVPINEIFGYINNLVEHCGCKIIILADEDNIGKTYANINVEQKYQTILSGGRRIDSGDNQNDNSISIKKLKELNEQLYSENYIYKDIKEKVIGRTLDYDTPLEELLVELVSEIKTRGYLGLSENYCSFLSSNNNLIANSFREIGSRNLRIINSWIRMYEDIWRETYERCGSSNNYNDIVSYFVIYSIWAMVSYKTNAVLVEGFQMGRLKVVYPEKKDYVSTICFPFIDKLIKCDYLDTDDIQSDIEMLDEYLDKKVVENDSSYEKTTGVEYVKLCNWQYMRDHEVLDSIENLMCEIRNGKYSISEYAYILLLLIRLDSIGFHIELNTVQKTMLSLIDENREMFQDNDIIIDFRNSKESKEFEKLYTPIKERIREHKKNLEKSKLTGDDLYEGYEKFYRHCSRNAKYYQEHRSFMQYIDIRRLEKLIKSSDLEGLYKISDALNKIYDVENAKEVFTFDIDMLVSLRNWLILKKNNASEMTKKYAIGNLIDTLSNILTKLGHDDSTVTE